MFPLAMTTTRTNNTRTELEARRPQVPAGSAVASRLRDGVSTPHLLTGGGDEIDPRAPGARWNAPYTRAQRGGARRGLGLDPPMGWRCAGWA